MTDINPTQAIILAVLHSKNAPGSYIEQQLEKLEGHWTVTRSQIYRELPKLAELGLVVKANASDEWRGSDPYAVTDAGREAYRDWYDNQALPYTTRNPWILRQRLSKYTGVTEEDTQLLSADAVEWAQEALAREQIKEQPDPLLIARFLDIIKWFSGSLG